MMAAYWRAYMPSLLCNALSHSGMLNIARINHVVIKEGMHMTEQHPSPEEKADAAAGRQQRKKIPVFILAIVGVFLVALLLYMFAGAKPSPSDAPPGHPDANAQPATMNDSTPDATRDEATAVDRDTATATDH